MRRPPSNLARQTGAALVVGLILLVVVTVLAISGMNTATTELAIARNDQNSEYAFQAAETGLEWALSRGFYETDPVVTPLGTRTAPGDYTVDTNIRFENTSIVPGDAAFSLSGGMAAYHFVAEATAQSTREAADAGSNAYHRDASAAHTQAFYIVGPEASSL